MTEFFTTVNEMDRDERRAYLQEGIILDVAEQIWAAMAKRGMTQKELAGALGTTPANVNRLLDGSRNMTLRAVSDIADALHLDIGIKFHARSMSAGKTSVTGHTDWTTPDAAMQPEIHGNTQNENHRPISQTG